MDEAFWRLTAGLADEARADQRGEARAIVAAERAGRCFADELRRLAPGDVVTVVTLDGAAIRGRIVSVGSDYVRVGEVADMLGAARLRLTRTHDVPLGAVVRVTREPAG